MLELQISNRNIAVHYRTIGTTAAELLKSILTMKARLLPTTAAFKLMTSLVLETLPCQIAFGSLALQFIKEAGTIF